MIRSPTVFVVGAGASCELGLPSGSALLAELATALDIRFGYGEQKSGDTRIFSAFLDLARQPDGRRGDANPYVHASWQIRDAAHLGLSIDNVINQLDADPLVPIAGKLGIARQLLLAEKSSLIGINRADPGDFPLAAVNATWLGRFAQLVCQDMQATSLANIFDNVSVVSFNYDRSIRRSLPHALRSQFALSDTMAEGLSKKLKIYYPYGSLGPLPYEVGYPEGVGYGEADLSSLTTVANSLRTFTEQIEDSADLSEMRDALSAADRIVFLGFGYHRQNMELLTTGVQPQASRVYGTSLGLSKSDAEVVANQLSFFYRDQYRGFQSPVLLPLRCVEFIDEHFRTFVSPRSS